MMQQSPLPRIEFSEISAKKPLAIDADTMQRAAVIVAAVKDRGLDGLFEYSRTLDGVSSPGDLIWERPQLEVEFKSLDSTTQELLQRVANQIENFAFSQRSALVDIDVPVPGGRAGHRVLPLRAAGCYAPGGRYPLPSSVLMTATTARAAGVSDITVCSPKPSTATLAAAYVAGADRFLAAGGAQAIAALAYGVDGISPVDVIVGPGNRWVTAAKKIVSGDVQIDMLAGPSELLIVADSGADARIIAADLLAQAEHDTDAVPMLVTTDVGLCDAVAVELEKQLQDLPTAAVARQALQNGFMIPVSSIVDAAKISEMIGPEHLEILVENPEQFLSLVSNYGGVFLGSMSAEVFGDYGVGPNHVLPTGGTARFTGGLSVLNFLKVSTWLQLSAGADTEQVIADTAELARIEGLEAHARAALLRKA